MRLINSWDSLQMRTCPNTSQALAETTWQTKTGLGVSDVKWLKIVEFLFWESEFYPEFVNRKVSEKCWQVTSSGIESKSFIIDMIGDYWVFWLLHILFFPQQVSIQ